VTYRIKVFKKRKVRFRNLKLLILLLRFIKLYLLIRVWQSIKNIISRKRRKRLERRFKKMSLNQDDGIPGMPGMENEEASSSPSTTSPAPESDVVSPELAGDLIDLPYQGWAVFEKRIPKEDIVLSNNMKAFLGGPVSRCMTKYGIGKIAKDEIIIVVTLSLHTASVIRAIGAAKKAQAFSIPKDDKEVVNRDPV
jgi:hypothetical protein